jgi:hypothetical protein
MNVGKIDRTIMKALDMVEKLEKLFANNGAFENAVMEIDGDISYFGDVRKKLAQLYVDIEDLHMGAVGHNMDESVTESVKLTEGVLDGDDEDGFMARSQLYFLARDAIALHGMISDQDDLQPWIQSKIAQTSKDIDAVRRYTEYNEMGDSGADPMDIGPAEEPEMEDVATEGYSVMPDIDREKYQERDGLEGPFQTKSGKVVYYDTKEGSYYDPDTDIYISYDEWRTLDESTQLNELLPVVPMAIQAALAAGRYVAPWLLRKFAGKGGATIINRAINKGMPSAVKGAKTLVKKHGAVKTGLGTAGRVGTGGAVGHGAATYGDEGDARVDNAADAMDRLRARDAKKRAGYYNADGSIKEGKSPHKKGTKKYNDHMAAMHANSAKPEGKMIEDKVKTEATEFFTKIKKQAGVNK